MDSSYHKFRFHNLSLSLLFALSTHLDNELARKTLHSEET